MYELFNRFIVYTRITGKNVVTGISLLWVRKTLRKGFYVNSTKLLMVPEDLDK